MRVCFLLLAGFIGTLPVQAQDHVHIPNMRHDAAAGPLPTSSGQAAFGAISEVIKLLTADSTTDWSKVNIEVLRQHLIDMDNVIMRAAVRPTNITGGVSLEVTGDGTIRRGIQRMLVAHAAELERMPNYHASARRVERGVILDVTSENPQDARTTARIRALGLAGLLAEGDHHPAHHLMLARGDQPHTGH